MISDRDYNKCHICEDRLWVVKEDYYSPVIVVIADDGPYHAHQACDQSPLRALSRPLD